MIPVAPWHSRIMRSRRRKTCLVLTILVITTCGYFVLPGIGRGISNLMFFASNDGLPGYHLAQRISKHCKQLDVSVTDQPSAAVHVFSSVNVQFCPVEEAETTFFKRLFVTTSLSKNVMPVNLYEFLYSRLYLEKEPIVADNRVKMMFVQNPYRRLVAGYITKFVVPNPEYWDRIGTEVISRFRPNANLKSKRFGHDVSFDEYIKFVIFKMTINQPEDMFAIMTRTCKPCEAQYDYVGKIETFKEDSIVLCRLLNLSEQTVKLLATQSDELRADDAITETMHQVFDEQNRRSFTKYMSVYEAMKRAWLALQMLGWIGRQQLPISESESLTITQREFVEKTLSSSRCSSTKEKSVLRHKHFVNLYKRVDHFDLINIRKIYQSDFHLFEYNTSYDSFLNTL